jgi:hypothetical protein
MKRLKILGLTALAMNFSMSAHASNSWSNVDDFGYFLKVTSYESENDSIVIQREFRNGSFFADLTTSLSCDQLNSVQFVTRFNGMNIQHKKKCDNGKVNFKFHGANKAKLIDLLYTSNEIRVENKDYKRSFSAKGLTKELDRMERLYSYGK